MTVWVAGADPATGRLWDTGDDVQDETGEIFLSLSLRGHARLICFHSLKASRIGSAAGLLKEEKVSFGLYL